MEWDVKITMSSLIVSNIYFITIDQHKICHIFILTCLSKMQILIDICQMMNYWGAYLINIYEHCTRI